MWEITIPKMKHLSKSDLAYFLEEDMIKLKSHSEIKSLLNYLKSYCLNQCIVNCGNTDCKVVLGWKKIDRFLPKIFLFFYHSLPHNQY